MRQLLIKEIQEDELAQLNSEQDRINNHRKGGSVRIAEELDTEQESAM